MDIFADRQRITKVVFKQVARERGWSLSNLAWRWNISLEHLLRTIAEENRSIRWDDALRGLPNLSNEDAQEIRAQRLAARPPPAPRTQQHARPDMRGGPGYRYHGSLVDGSVLLTCEALGEIPEGARAVVRRTDDNGCVERYLVEFDDYGSFWMSPDEIDASLVETGECEPG